MSICRWSCDGFQCDVYVYESEHGGYRAHVAGSRRPRRVCDLDSTTPSAFVRSRKQQLNELKDPTNQPAPIGGPHDGKSFTVDLQDLEKLLLDLRSEGYRVPEWVLERVRQHSKNVT